MDKSDRSCATGRLTAAGLALLACIVAGASNAQPATAQTINPLALTLDHVTIGVADFDKEIDWYHRVLGLQPGDVLHTPQFDAQKMTGPGIRIDLIHRPSSSRPAPTMGFDKQGFLHVALTAPDMDAAYKQLTATGVQVAATKNKAGKIIVMTMTDPEGNGIEILPR